MCIKTSSSCVWAVVMAQDSFSLSTAERERCQELCALLTECIQGRQTEMIREQSSFSILTSLFCLLCQSSLCFFLFTLSLSSFFKTLFFLFQAWADAFRSSPDLTGVVQMYEELKRKGIEFPMSDLETLSPIHTPQRVGGTIPNGSKGLFPPKSKMHVFPLACCAICPFRLLWCELLSPV